MRALFTTRLFWLLWLATLCLFAADWLYPLSDGITRSVGPVLIFLAWFGLLALKWNHRPIRIALLAITGIIAVFLGLPAKSRSDTTALRSDYVAGLRRYEGVPYYWGGESPKGIDCSGLIRRGLIDAEFLHGIRTLDSGLVRRSIWLWWHDASAKTLGEGHGFTAHLFETPQINGLDHSKLLPGDLAVTRGGAHVMAYLGGDLWIEADPSAGKVITVKAPSENGWFHGPMNIVRWLPLQ